MRKLISANFFRLWKDKIFWFILVIVIASSIINIDHSIPAYNMMIERGYIRGFEYYYFKQVPMLGCYFALFAGLFLGTEYSDGTLRNKLSVGHKREHVYFANFVVCMAASFIFLAAWLLINASGFFLIGPMEMGATGYMTYVLIVIGVTVSFAALFTLIGSLSSNKEMTVIFTMIVFWGMSGVASGLYDRLTTPEMNEGMTYINGEFVMMEATPNPLYLTGTLRTICECILELLPEGQALLMNNIAIEHPVRAIVFSILFTAVMLLAGCTLFCRKDIK